MILTRIICAPIAKLNGLRHSHSRVSSCMREQIPSRFKFPVGNIHFYTSLHVAAFKDKHADCLKLLLRNKRTLQLNLDAKTSDGKTALYLACSEGCVKNCGILLRSKCNPEIPDRHGYTPLNVASLRGRASILSQLISHGINPNCQNPGGDTALHTASEKDSVEVVRVLMKRKQAKVNICNSEGELPLHVACRRDSLEIVRILLKTDRSLINYCCPNGCTPLTVAISCRCFESMKYLLDQGANVNHSTVDHKTILRYAFDSGIKEIMVSVLNKSDPAYIREKSMLEISGYLSRRRGHLSSLMTSVIRSAWPECMMSLLQSGVPKDVLETPYLVYRQSNNTFYVYSPLAYLFYAAKRNVQPRRNVDKLLQLLLQYNITHLYEFSQMVELKGGREETILYVHPFTNIFEGSCFTKKRNHFLKTLFKCGITTDYCLQCDVRYKGRFLDFDVNALERFYQPVIWAIEQDNAVFIELFLVSSAILEPSHLWNFLQYRSSVKNPRNVVNYLIDIGVMVNTSNLPLYPFGGTIKCPNLKQLCRQVIRKHLRDVTIQDNFKNFKNKIKSLPLPNVLKNYLRFNGR